MNALDALEPVLEPLLDWPLLLYSRARSANFALQFALLNSLSSLFPGLKGGRGSMSPETAIALHEDLLELLKRDARNIREGIYPLSVLKPESPIGHLLRIPRIMMDGVSIYRRRGRGRTTEFARVASEFLEGLPAYYRRNFHFQSDGYLSKRSARLYEHQVELLFGGTADPMRRLILPPMRDALDAAGASRARKGQGLSILEIGAGTGRATRFTHLAFPRAKIVATDLSYPYLKEAQRRLADLPRIDFLQADAARLPFRKARFDAVYSIFMFHELPMSARKAIVAEAKRALKPGGFFGIVDSIQQGERKELDSLLQSFPHDYHEPFYRDYISHPLEDLLEEGGFENVRTDRGLFSKVCWGRSAAGGEP